MNKKPKKTAGECIATSWKLYRELDNHAYEKKRREHEERSRIEAKEKFRNIQRQDWENKKHESRFANTHDIEQAGLLDKPRKLYLGIFENKFLSYSDDGHLLTYGRTGSGKGRDVIIPNLAFIKHSIFCIDPKGENAACSYQHRSINLKQEIIFINPWNIRGLPNHNLNPLDILKDVRNNTNLLLDKASEIANLLIQKPANAGSNEWVYIGARQLLEVLLIYIAHSKPEKCYLSYIWEIVNYTIGKLGELFNKIKHSPIKFLQIKGAKILDMIKLEDNAKHFDILTDTLSTALNSYKAGSVLGEATKKTSLDPSILKQKPTTLYLMIPPEQLKSNATWVAMITAHLIEKVAHTQGNVRTTFLLDEFANLPRLESVLTALRLYRGYNVQLWFFLQGRHSLEPAYTSAERKEIEDQAGVMQLWNVEDTSLASDIEKMAGYKNIRTQSDSYSAGTVQSGGMNSSEQKQPILPADKLRILGEQKQLLKIQGCRMIVCNRPPWWEFDDWAKVIVNLKK